MDLIYFCQIKPTCCFYQHIAVDKVDILDVAFPETIDYLEYQRLLGKISNAYFFVRVCCHILIACACKSVWFDT